MKIHADRWLSIILLLPILTGCSESEKVAPGEQSSNEQQEDVWAAQRQPMDKAKALEQQLQEQADRRREEMEKQGY